MITGDDVEPVLVPLEPGSERATCTGCALSCSHLPHSAEERNLTSMCGRLGCGTTAVGHRIIYKEKQK